MTVRVAMMVRGSQNRRGIRRNWRDDVGLFYVNWYKSNDISYVFENYENFHGLIGLQKLGYLL